MTSSSRSAHGRDPTAAIDDAASPPQAGATSWPMPGSANLLCRHPQFSSDPLVGSPPRPEATLSQASDLNSTPDPARHASVPTHAVVASVASLVGAVPPRTRPLRTRPGPPSGPGGRPLRAGLSESRQARRAGPLTGKRSRQVPVLTPGPWSRLVDQIEGLKPFSMTPVVLLTPGRRKPIGGRISVHRFPTALSTDFAGDSPCVHTPVDEICGRSRGVRSARRPRGSAPASRCRP